MQQYEERTQGDVGQVEAPELAHRETPRCGGLPVVEKIARDEKENGGVEIVGDGLQRCSDRGVRNHHCCDAEGFDDRERRVVGVCAGAHRSEIAVHFFEELLACHVVGVRAGV